MQFFISIGIPKKNLLNFLFITRYIESIPTYKIGTLFPREIVILLTIEQYIGTTYRYLNIVHCMTFLFKKKH